MNKQHPTKPRPAPTIVCALFTLAVAGLHALAVHTEAPTVFSLTFAGCAFASTVLTGLVLEAYFADRHAYAMRRHAAARGDLFWQNRGY